MALDLSILSQPISDESPSGADLEYDPVFLEMMAAAEAKPERQMGDSVIEAEDPDWKTVKVKGLDLIERSKDIRVLIAFANAIAHTEGVADMRVVLEGLQQVLVDFWSSVHPQLDPDDQDPMMRVNAASALADQSGLIKTLREIPLVESKVIGRFSMRDIELAESGTGGEGAATPDLIAAAFMDVELEELQETVAAFEGASAACVSIDEHLTEQVGAQGPDLRPLLDAFQSIHSELNSRLSMRGVGVDSEEDEAGEAGGGAASNPSGVNNRQDVVRMIDLICDYYRRAEPSSPIPVLLERARSLVDKNFLDVVRDLVPAGLDQAQIFQGSTDEEY